MSNRYYQSLPSIAFSSFSSSPPLSQSLISINFLPFRERLSFESSRDFNDNFSCDQVCIVCIMCKEHNKNTVQCELVLSQHIVDF